LAAGAKKENLFATVDKLGSEITRIAKCRPINEADATHSPLARPGVRELCGASHFMRFGAGQHFVNFLWHDDS
jgi:hypothetical protein